MEETTQEYIQRNTVGPGWLAQLVRALSRYTKVAGLIPGQGTHKKQPMSA